MLKANQIKICPLCEKMKIVRNGRTAGGPQNYKCKGCGRQFVLHPRKRRINANIKTIILRLLAEDISVPTIARATQVSHRWLYALKKKGLQNDR
ncbi:MAG: hypothetical protein QME06_10665 [Desulfobacterales bacterium]|nr:hypothetical protein [Desulfobacterales bacterium]